MTAMKSGIKMEVHTMELISARDLRASEFGMFFKNLEEELIHARMCQKRGREHGRRSKNKEASSLIFVDSCSRAFAP